MTKATSASRSRRQFWLFALLSLIFAYLASLGMTFNGILALVDLQSFTLGLFGLLSGLIARATTQNTNQIASP